MIIPIQTPGAKLLALAFDDLDQFRDWARGLNPYDLEYWRVEFEKEEMYEWCAILRDAKREARVVYLYNGLNRIEDGS